MRQHDDPRFDLAEAPKATRVCVECKSHKRDEPHSCRAEIWYNQECMAPDAQTDRPSYPNCRDVRDGETCKYFEQKKGRAR